MSAVSPQGSYWAIDTNPKEDTVPSRPKKRPRSGERVHFSLSRRLKKKQKNVKNRSRSRGGRGAREAEVEL